MKKLVNSLFQTPTKIALGAILAYITLAAPSAFGQGFSNRWFQVGAAVYQGGTVRMEFPFSAEVETSQIAVVVPAHCAPRALASRATVWDSFSNWTRSVNLKNQRQEVVGGYIRAFFGVHSPFDNETPVVTGVTFSFTEVRPGFQSPCQITVYALPE